ncbi:helix-turn-helix domain-containing protein [Herbaspirillum sp. NPDC101396]|uniref:helix-turn-helix domain-containing protein n=1 Tax=Herbaspirillum sp. NPDC101396 TaxID=3364005 RepID=UPI00383AE34C
MTIRLKLLRKQKGWTLETLADQSGLTKSYLSKIERGVSMPSIAVALKLARALQVDVGQLASDAGSDQLISITRASARTAMAKTADGARPVESIAADIAPKEMLPFMMYPPQDFVASAFKEHEGEEFLFVHKGRIDVEFPDQLVQLKAGDSLYFNALIPHRTRSTGSVQAEVMVIVSNRER